MCVASPERLQRDKRLPFAQAFDTLVLVGFFFFAFSTESYLIQIIIEVA